VWKPDRIDLNKVDFMQNEDLTSNKGGVLTMTRKYAIDKPTLVESFKSNMLVSEFTIEQRHIACVNLYV